MNDKLVITDDVIDTAASSVDRLSESLGAMSGDARRFACMTGHRELHDQVERSADSWQIHRSKLGGTLSAVSKTLKEIRLKFDQAERSAADAFKSVGGQSRTQAAEVSPTQADPVQDRSGATTAPTAPDTSALPQASVAPLRSPSPDPAPQNGFGGQDAHAAVPEPAHAAVPPPDQARIRQLLAEFAARWQELTGMPPEALALLGLAIGGAIRSGAHLSGGRGDHGHHHHDRDRDGDRTAPGDGRRAAPVPVTGPAEAPCLEPSEPGAARPAEEMPELNPLTTQRTDPNPQHSTAPGSQPADGPGQPAPPSGPSRPMIPLEPLPDLAAPAAPGSAATAAPAYQAGAPAPAAGSSLPTPDALPDLSAAPVRSTVAAAQSLPPLDVAQQPSVTSNDPVEHSPAPLAMATGMGLRTGSGGSAAVAAPSGGPGLLAGTPPVGSTTTADRDLPSLDAVDHTEEDLDD